MLDEEIEEKTIDSYFSYVRLFGFYQTVHDGCCLVWFVHQRNARTQETFSYRTSPSI